MLKNGKKMLDYALGDFFGERALMLKEAQVRLRIRHFQFGFARHSRWVIESVRVGSGLGSGLVGIFLFRNMHNTSHSTSTPPPAGPARCDGAVRE